MVNTRSIKSNLLVLLVVLVASIFPMAPVAAAVIPVTDGTGTQTLPNTTAIQPMADFVSAIQDGEEVVRGVYVNDVMALRVIQQPANDPGFVSAIAGVATQFSMASQYNVVGLLAHNFAAGSYFSQIETGDVVSVIYGDGEVDAYLVSQIIEFQALSPNSPSSKFVDLVEGDTLSATNLFKKVYTGDPHLVLQTCIARGTEASWGRMFIIAQPIEAEAE